MKKLKKKTYLDPSNKDLMDFIKVNCDNLDWFAVSCEDELSEDFIRLFQDKVEWYFICGNQKLSESFIKEFADKMVWRELWRNPYIDDLSEEFLMELQLKGYLDFD